MSKCYISKWTILVVLATGPLITTLELVAKQCENCVIITDCLLALDLLKQRDSDSLRKIFCGFDQRGPKVCCSPNNPIVFTNETETATSRNRITTITSTTENEIENGLPSRSVCGKSRASQDRIVGGDIASIEEFPWLVRIKSRNKMNPKDRETYRCGGNLISNRYVLTAAHCVLERDITSVRLGEWDTETLQDCDKGVCNDPPVDVNITKVIVHPLYIPSIFDNDISIIELEKAINFTDFIRPICLPSTKYAISQDYITGTIYWTAGWGITEFHSSSIVKRKVDLDAVPIEMCYEKFPPAKKVDPNNIICAGSRGGKDSCSGDSGGPLVKEILEDGQSNWYLYGVTSFGPTQCGKGIPAAYARVVTYMDWIKSNIAS